MRVLIFLHKTYTGSGNDGPHWRVEGPDIRLWVTQYYRVTTTVGQSRLTTSTQCRPSRNKFKTSDHKSVHWEVATWR